MRIFLFDYQTTRTNAIGNCNWLIVNGLNEEHDFTLFSTQYEGSVPAGVRFVRVPVPRTPLVLLLILYHIVAPVMMWYRKRQDKAADSESVNDIEVQTIGPNLLTGSILAVHFCNRVYLKEHWRSSRAGGLRGVARYLDHLLQSLLEPVAFGRAKTIVVPSQGLKRELERVFPRAVNGKIHVIPNPINAERMQRPADFDRKAKRAELNFKDDDLVMVFVAAGHFERKGLPLLLEAMHQVADHRVKLVIVGGRPGALQPFKERVRALNLSYQVHFAGFQQDVRPFLWLADLFAFPSAYETFSLVTFEAAAAGLPLLVTHLHGVEDMLVDGENGWCVERRMDELVARISYALDHREELRAMGLRAADSVTDLGEDSYVDKWRVLYAAYEAGTL